MRQGKGTQVHGCAHPFPQAMNQAPPPKLQHHLSEQYYNHIMSG